ncbi:unnamed protein product [Symbiodinium microadriaticum]|nr:unnamed protein product [Symbiodinium microadriaticum]
MRARSQSRCRPSTRPTRPGESLHGSAYATSYDPARTVSISMGQCVTRMEATLAPT